MRHPVMPTKGTLPPKSKGIRYDRLEQKTNASRAVCSYLSPASPTYATAAQDNASAVLTFAQAQTAGMDGREWDKSFPGAMTVDAVHRTVLLRFPSTAEKIKGQLGRGANHRKS